MLKVCKGIAWCPILQAAFDAKELERLRNSESLLRLLVDSIPAFISYIDFEQKYVFANALYAEFFGLGTQPTGLHVSKVLGDETYLMVRTHIEAALRGERQSYEYDLSHGGKLRHLKILALTQSEAKGLGIGRSTLHYLRKNASNQREFMVREKVKERLLSAQVYETKSAH